jgi:hypothetical protein
MSEDNSNTWQPLKPFVRQHGFQKPFNAMQISSWVFFALETLSFYILVAPSIYLYSLPMYIVVQSINAVLIISIVILAIIATKSDTTDPIILKMKRLK